MLEHAAEFASQLRVADKNWSKSMICNVTDVVVQPASKASYQLGVHAPTV